VTFSGLRLRFARGAPVVEDPRRVDSLAANPKHDCSAELVVADAADPARRVAEATQPDRDVALRSSDVATEGGGLAHRTSLLGEQQDHGFAQSDQIEHQIRGILPAAIPRRGPSRDGGVPACDPLPKGPLRGTLGGSARRGQHR